MGDLAYLLQFSDVTLAESNQYAAELRGLLLDADPAISVERKRETEHTQDFGASLAVMLATPGVIAFVKAIGDWLKLRRGARITIRSANGEIVAENITSADAARLADKLLAQ